MAGKRDRRWEVAGKIRGRMELIADRMEVRDGCAMLLRDPEDVVAVFPLAEIEYVTEATPEPEAEEEAAE